MNIFSDSNLFPYFEGDSLVGKDLPLKMTKVHFEDLPDHKWQPVQKMTLGFVGTEKRLVLNKTNAKRIALIYGAETDNWRGKEITLISERVHAFGKWHNAIRIKLTDAQSENVFEQPSEVDPVTEVPTVDPEEWQPSKEDFYAALLKDFSKGKFIMDMATANDLFKNDCGESGLKELTQNGVTWIGNASKLYNCLAEVMAKRPMPESDAIPTKE